MHCSRAAQCFTSIDDIQHCSASAEEQTHSISAFDSPPRPPQPSQTAMSHLQLPRRALCQYAITAPTATPLSLTSLHSWLSLSSSSIHSSRVPRRCSTLPSSSASRLSFTPTLTRSFAAAPKKDAKKGAKKEETIGQHTTCHTHSLAHHLLCPLRTLPPTPLPLLPLSLTPLPLCLCVRVYRMLCTADPNRPIDVSFIHSWKADPIPQLRADADYPPWIFDPALYNPPSLAELRVRRDQGEVLSEELVKRMDKLERRRRIKQRNDESRKH